MLSHATTTPPLYEQATALTEALDDSKFRRDATRGAAAALYSILKNIELLDDLNAHCEMYGGGPLAIDLAQLARARLLVEALGDQLIG